MTKAVESAMMTAMEKVEQKVDAQLDQLASLDDDGLEAIRRRRISEMQKASADRAVWRRNGHGVLHRITEKDFFDRAKGVSRMVAVFHRAGSSRYATDLLEHIRRIAEAHLETLFVDIDAVNAPFLATRLNLRVMPSIVMLKDAEIHKVLVGLDELSSTGNFTTGGMEKRLFSMEMLIDTNISDES